jgi:hypothetical protein
MMEGWFKEFPEIEHRFPGKNLADLMEEESAVLTTAIEDRRKVIEYDSCT